MNLDKLVVVFDSPTDTYYAGQNVTGQVQLLLMGPKKIRSLQIKFVGKGEVKWSEQVKIEGRTQLENIVYSDDEEYYTFKYNLAGGGNSELHLPPGQHNFSFAACLPPGLPASFEGDRGFVRYSVTATLERPWNSSEYATAIFTVISPIDLNYNPLAKAPVHMDVEKSFCCCWCRSGPLQLVLGIPHSGWVPGQAIPLTLELDNASNVTVTNLIVKLEKVLDWKARNPQPNQCRDRVELSKLTLPGVEPGGSKSWCQLLPIPSVATFNLDQCTIINCSYALTAKAVVGGCHTNLTMEVPVFLGTVPFYEAGPTDTPSAPPPPTNASIGFNLDASQWCYPSMTTPLLPTQNGFRAAQ